MSGIMYERIPDGDHPVADRRTAARRAEIRIASNNPRPQRSLAIIDGRVLSREHLSWGLLANGLGLHIVNFGSVEDIEDFDATDFSAILVCVDDTRFMDNSIVLEIDELVLRFPNAPVIVQADMCGFQQILTVLEHGARGYLPGNAGISVCMEAISMALAGGVFVAAENLGDIQRILGTRRYQSKRGAMFTPREEDVIQVLRLGKANKSIAYTLNLAPNTVKVHVRNILKKLRVTNRAEAIYKINSMFDEVA